MLTVFLITKKKYISFTKNISIGNCTNKKGEAKPINHQIRFIDSFRFMATSLSQLVTNLDKFRFNNARIH